jgi:hypothetical protein
VLPFCPDYIKFKCVTGFDSLIAVYAHFRCLLFCELISLLWTQPLNIVSQNLCAETFLPHLAHLNI